MNSRTSLFAMMLVIAWASQGLANNVHNVELNRDYATINSALADGDLEPGHTLVVEPGTYNESVNINIDITLKSTYETDPNARDTTIIVGGASLPGVDMTTGTLQGLTITDSRTAVYAGGDSWVIDNIIRDNISLTYASGGVWAYESAQILFNEIRHNAPCGIFGTAEGGGVYATDDAMIVGNLIEDNFGYCESPVNGGDDDGGENASPRGGGVLSGGGVYAIGDARVISNVIRNNSASYGGGVSVCCGASKIINNTITGNSSLIYGDAMIHWGGQTGPIANNIIAFHDGKAIEDFGAPPPLFNNLFFANTGGNGPTGTSPVFADPMLDADGIHLLAGSPAIDVGDNSYLLPGELDFDATARIQNGAVDIGADEFFVAVNCGFADSDCCSSHAEVGCNTPSCCEQVCGANPYCCTVGWDESCAAAALDNPLCPCGPTCPGIESCCWVHESAACDDSACCESISAIRAECREETWDEVCVLLAEAVCGQCEICAAPGLNGTFGFLEDLAGEVIGYYPTSIVAGDLDNDDDVDLAVGNSGSETISIFTNAGNGVVTQTQSVVLSDFNESMTIADLNGDGFLDLAVPERFDNQISIQLNQGDATFTMSGSVATGNSPNAIASADFDEDGDIDLATAHASGPDFPGFNGDVWTYTNDGAAGFTVGGETYVVGPMGLDDLAAADLDGDGHSDLIVLSSNLNILLGDGDGTFASPALVHVGFETYFYGRDVAVGDVDSDDDIDIVVNDAHTLHVFVNGGTASFAAPVTYLAPGPYDVVFVSAEATAVADVTGDGFAELLVRDKDGFLGVFPNNGDGTFGTVQQFVAGDTPEALAVADMDADGDLDVAVANSGSDDVSILLNTLLTDGGDCNQNGVADSCDVADGNGHDLNANGVLDECEVLIAHNVTSGIGFPTIQEAIDAAQAGDEIEVDPGMHFENVDFFGKSITVRSHDPFDSAVVAATIIDGSGVDTVVQMSAGVLSGFTIRNGSAFGPKAGGVEANGTAEVSNNVISENFAELRGGGVSATDSAFVHNNHIVENTAGNRAGGVSGRDDAVIINNVISGNHATIGGGGLRAQENVLVRNNTLVGNSSEDTGTGVQGGGGILAEDSAVLLSNIIAFSSDGAGIHVDPGATVTADYNCVFGNVEGDYGGDALAGINDVNADPLLHPDNVHLAVNSPCIDAGDPATVLLSFDVDIDNGLRILNNRIDIGADETAPPLGCDGDANGDGTVDPLDSGYVQARFGCPVNSGDPSCDAADVNADGVVDPLDVGYVLARFGECP